MHTRLKIGAAFGLASLSLTAPAAAQTQGANPTSYFGSFLHDNEENRNTVSVTALGSVTMYTTSFGGGLNLNGTTTTPGGFDPVLTLFDSAGKFISENDNSPTGGLDPVTGFRYDASITVILAPGSYKLVLTQFGNFAKASPTDGTGASNLSDGFTQDGFSNQFYTTKYDTAGNTFPSFVDKDGAERTHNYAVNYTNSPQAPPPAVPEASTTVSLGLLLLLGLGGAAFTARKKTR